MLVQVTYFLLAALLAASAPQRSKLDFPSGEPQLGSPISLSRDAVTTNSEDSETPTLQLGIDSPVEVIRTSRVQTNQIDEGGNQFPTTTVIKSDGNTETIQRQVLELPTFVSIDGSKPSSSDGDQLNNENPDAGTAIFLNIESPTSKLEDELQNKNEEQNSDISKSPTPTLVLETRKTAQGQLAIDENVLSQMVAMVNALKSNSDVKRALDTSLTGVSENEKNTQQDLKIIDAEFSKRDVSRTARTGVDNVGAVVFSAPKGEAHFFSEESIPNVDILESQGTLSGTESSGQKQEVKRKSTNSGTAKSLTKISGHQSLTEERSQAEVKAAEGVKEKNIQASFNEKAASKKSQAALTTSTSTSAVLAAAPRGEAHFETKKSSLDRDDTSTVIKTKKHQSHNREASKKAKSFDEDADFEETLIASSSSNSPTIRVKPQNYNAEYKKESVEWPPLMPYNFAFEVRDDETTNYQNRVEVVEDGVLRGSFSFLGADGVIRTVTYSDDGSGFKIQTHEIPTDVIVIGSQDYKTQRKTWNELSSVGGGKVTSVTASNTYQNQASGSSTGATASNTYQNQASGSSTGATASNTYQSQASGSSGRKSFTSKASSSSSASASSVAGSKSAHAKKIKTISNDDSGFSSSFSQGSSTAASQADTSASAAESAGQILGTSLGNIHFLSSISALEGAANAGNAASSGSFSEAIPITSAATTGSGASSISDSVSEAVSFASADAESGVSSSSGGASEAVYTASADAESDVSSSSGGASEAVSFASADAERDVSSILGGASEAVSFASADAESDVSSSSGGASEAVSFASADAESDVSSISGGASEAVSFASADAESDVSSISGGASEGVSFASADAESGASSISGGASEAVSIASAETTGSEVSSISGSVSEAGTFPEFSLSSSGSRGGSNAVGSGKRRYKFLGSSGGRGLSTDKSVDSDSNSSSRFKSKGVFASSLTDSEAAISSDSGSAGVVSSLKGTDKISSGGAVQTTFETGSKKSSFSIQGSSSGRKQASFPRKKFTVVQGGLNDREESREGQGDGNEEESSEGQGDGHEEESNEGRGDEDEEESHEGRGDNSEVEHSQENENDGTDEDESENESGAKRNKGSKEHKNRGKFTIKIPSSKLSSSSGAGSLKHQTSSSSSTAGVSVSETSSGSSGDQGIISSTGASSTVAQLGSSSGSSVGGKQSPVTFIFGSHALSGDRLTEAIRNSKKFKQGQVSQSGAKLFSDFGPNTPITVILGNNQAAGLSTGVQAQSTQLSSSDTGSASGTTGSSFISSAASGAASSSGTAAVESSKQVSSSTGKGTAPTGLTKSAKSVAASSSGSKQVSDNVSTSSSGTAASTSSIAGGSAAALLSSIGSSSSKTSGVGSSFTAGGSSVASEQKSFAGSSAKSVAGTTSSASSSKSASSSQSSTSAHRTAVSEVIGLKPFSVISSASLPFRGSSPIAVPTNLASASGTSSSTSTSASSAGVSGAFGSGSGLGSHTSSKSVASSISSSFGAAPLSGTKPFVPSQQALAPAPVEILPAIGGSLFAETGASAVSSSNIFGSGAVGGQVGGTNQAGSVDSGIQIFPAQHSQSITHGSGISSSSGNSGFSSGIGGIISPAFSLPSITHGSGISSSSGISGFSSGIGGIISPASSIPSITSSQQSLTGSSSLREFLSGGSSGSSKSSVVRLSPASFTEKQIVSTSSAGGLQQVSPISFGGGGRLGFGSTFNSFAQNIPSFRPEITVFSRPSQGAVTSHGSTQQISTTGATGESGFSIVKANPSILSVQRPANFAQTHSGNIGQLIVDQGVFGLTPTGNPNQLFITSGGGKQLGGSSSLSSLSHSQSSSVSSFKPSLTLQQSIAGGFRPSVPASIAFGKSFPSVGNSARGFDFGTSQF